MNEEAIEAPITLAHFEGVRRKGTSADTRAIAWRTGTSADNSATAASGSAPTLKPNKRVTFDLPPLRPPVIRYMAEPPTQPIIEPQPAQLVDQSPGRWFNIPSKRTSSWTSSEISRMVSHILRHDQRIARARTGEIDADILLDRVNHARPAGYNIPNVLLFIATLIQQSNNILFQCLYDWNNRPVSFRAIQGHTACNPTDNVLGRRQVTAADCPFLYHGTSFASLEHIARLGLIPGGLTETNKRFDTFSVQ